MLILLYAAVAFGYLGMAVWAWFEMSPQPLAAVASGGARFGVSSVPVFGPLERTGTALLWLAHVWLLSMTVSDAEGWRFGFALVLSATMALAVAVFWFESFYFEVASMRLLILPIAAICAALPIWFPGSRLAGEEATRDGALRNAAFDAHLVVALLAYGLLTIAALQALVMSALDRWLHGSAKRAESASLTQSLQRALLGPLPPLLAMERVLFRIIALGFGLLTLTLVTGMVFSRELFHRPMQLDERTAGTVISWLIFGALLTGRALYGWRGRIALRWTLAGFLATLLAYAVLHRV